MAGKYKELAEVLKQECIAPDIYSMWLQTDKIAEQAVPGQFISVYSNDGSRLLPRPISLCEIDKDKKALRIVYRVPVILTNSLRITIISCGRKRNGGVCTVSER